MARIQVMHLPDDAFALVIDQVQPGDALADPATAPRLRTFSTTVGSAGVLVTQDTLDVA